MRLASDARSAGARVTLIAHELFEPWLLRPDLMLAALTQRLQFAALLRNCDHVFVTTETRASQIALTCHLLRLPAPGVVRVGANALPVRCDRGVKGGARLGVFSTAAVGKRFDVVLGAFSLVARELPSAELVIMGDLGPPERPLVREILDAARRHPAAARIRMTGKLALSEIAAEIACLDLYLFPMSTGANTRSGTLPVALGSGLPVVAVRGSETDLSLFKDRENILFAKQLSGRAFGGTALGLLRDPPLMERVGKGARRLYENELSWSRIADRLLARI
jgi:glycosyltransferase involved in cell wall biosynthesis